MSTGTRSNAITLHAPACWWPTLLGWISQRKKPWEKENNNKKEIEKEVVPVDWL
jgi:hypothetical protein